MSKLTGYGRGWSEPKAKTLIGRVFQRLREPATTTEWTVVVFVMVFLAALISSQALAAVEQVKPETRMQVEKPIDAHLEKTER
ncbi:hypothetical protein [Rhizobium sp. GN54]|uniref:hypothetical protein n=1 Tax=Rhizobium sp. GN54 TaxID=2898150 RepID=UPI001E2A58EA|nr:hypothetical protein [Rhizobium sp. GN54]MCD2183323.1 hypothetical protein [Rhizobium sp. GN54]